MASGRTLDRCQRANPVVPGLVCDLRQAERLQQRRQVDAEPTPQALLESVPTAHRIVLRAAPGLDRPGCGRFLLVRAAERHPVAVGHQHGVQVLDRS
jgi:hypothetical protein